MHPRRPRAALVVLLALPFALDGVRCGAAEPAVDVAERAAVVDAVAEQLEALYVDEALARRAAAALRDLARSGGLDELREPEALAARLTAELRRITRDLHVEVRLRAAPAGTGAAAANADWREPLRRRGHDFRRLDWLGGGVAYLDLRSFPPLEVARPAADAALALLGRADALILDLRRNGGGTGEMAELLASWFLPPRTLLATTIKRSRGETRESRTRDDVPATSLRTAPLFLLTSGSTFSAAEALAYELQARGRAVVVGERT